MSFSFGSIEAISKPYARGWLLTTIGVGAVFYMATSMFGIAILLVLVPDPETKRKISTENY
jgi:hypothetical protein